MTDLRVASAATQSLLRPAPTLRVVSQSTQALLRDFASQQLRFASIRTQVLIGPVAGTPWRVWTGADAVAAEVASRYTGTLEPLTEAAVGIWNGTEVVPVRGGFT